MQDNPLGFVAKWPKEMLVLLEMNLESFQSSQAAKLHGSFWKPQSHQLKRQYKIARPIHKLSHTALRSLLQRNMEQPHPRPGLVHFSGNFEKQKRLVSSSAVHVNRAQSGTHYAPKAHLSFHCWKPARIFLQKR